MLQNAVFEDVNDPTTRSDPSDDLEKLLRAIESNFMNAMYAHRWQAEHFHVQESRAGNGPLCQ